MQDTLKDALAAPVMEVAQQIQKKRQSQKTLDRYLQNEQAAKRKKNQLE